MPSVNFRLSVTYLVFSLDLLFKYGLVSIFVNFPKFLVSFSIKNMHSSDKQHLSYGVCLEVRGEIIRTVLCCIVYDRCVQS